MFSTQTKTLVVEATTAATITVDLDKGAFLQTSFFAVEEPFIISDAIPKTFKQSVGQALNKTAFNLFESFEKASEYCQRVNRPLVIIEIKPLATSKPQLALVQKISA